MNGLDVLLERFAYQPRWTFELSRQGTLQILTVTAWVQDAYAPGRWRPTRSRFTVPPAVGPYAGSEQFWMEWLRDCLIKLAIHEADEWFAVDGRRPFDPHAVAS